MTIVIHRQQNGSYLISCSVLDATGVYYGYSKRGAIKAFRRDNSIRYKHCLIVEY